MQKVFTAYAEHFNIQENSLRFLVDGDRILANQTATECGLEEDGVIDALLEQEGG